MIVVVHVRSDDTSTRNEWRGTYGNKRLMDKVNYSLLFSVGTPNGTKDQELLLEEARLHRDILQTNIDDTYRNLTYKACSFFYVLLSVIHG
ncbi:hypothetical protein COOONC_06977 [Cooperia oncophora]